MNFNYGTYSSTPGEPFGQASVDMYMDIVCKGGSTFAADCLGPAPAPAPAPSTAVATTTVASTSKAYPAGITGVLFIFVWYAINGCHW